MSPLKIILEVEAGKDPSSEMLLIIVFGLNGRAYIVAVILAPFELALTHFR